MMEKAANVQSKNNLTLQESRASWKKNGNKMRGDSALSQYCRYQRKLCSAQIYLIRHFLLT